VVIGGAVEVPLNDGSAGLAVCQTGVEGFRPEVEAMTVTQFDHVQPWTEEEYFALGETSDRVELFDGSLVVSPAPTPRHQTAARRLANLLEVASGAGLEVYEAINVRLKPGRVPIPDLVLTSPVDPDTLVVDATDIALICEITSPSNASHDRVLRMHQYAEAGIPWYLLIDPDTSQLLLFQRDGQRYVLHAEGKPGHPLLLTEPVAVEIDATALGLA
jgi:Uma2 family endonuclease